MPWYLSLKRSCPSTCDAPSSQGSHRRRRGREIRPPCGCEKRSAVVLSAVQSAPERSSRGRGSHRLQQSGEGGGSPSRPGRTPRCSCECLRGASPQRLQRIGPSAPGQQAHHKSHPTYRTWTRQGHVRRSAQLASKQQNCTFMHASTTTETTTVPIGAVLF